MSNTNDKQLAAATAGFPALNTRPDLAKAEVAPTELLGEYWTPEAAGESKRVFFAGFDTQSVIEQSTCETRELNIVKFVEKIIGTMIWTNILEHLYGPIKGPYYSNVVFHLIRLNRC